MALNLLQASNLAPDPLTRMVIDEFAAGDLLARIPFEDEEGTGVHYNRVDSLPGVAFRGLNEAYPESTGVVNPQSEAFKLFGGDLDVDASLVAMKGAGIRSTHEQLKVKNLRLSWEYNFIKGDTASNPREFDGLQKRITGSQLISNAAAGAALSLGNLDKLLSQIEMADGNTYLYMSRRMRDRLSQANRTNTLNNFLETGEDQFGKKVQMYGGVPILVDSLSNPILAFDETSPDGASSTVCTSIYALTFGPMMCTGIQGRNPQGGFGISVRDLGELDSKPVYRTRVDWNNSMAIYNGYSVARLYGVTDAAVVV